MKEKCLKMIEQYEQAEEALLTGKRYKIGSRELERMSLEEIQKGKAYWENKLKELTRKKANIKVVIPRDW